MLTSFKLFETKIECDRCGTCCFTGNCGMGEEDEEGVCKEVVINKDGTVSCGKLLRGEVRPEQIGVNGGGCVMKRMPDIMAHYKDRTDYLKNQRMPKEEPKRKSILRRFKDFIR